MSRCITFPPPGYNWSGVSGEGLIELIKLRGETAKAEKEKKKAERRKEKKTRKNEKKNTHNSKKEDPAEKGDTDTKDLQRSDNQRKRKYETEGLDRSSITEEFEQPISGSVYSSDDNSRSSKRNKSAYALKGCHNFGTVISIDPEGMSTKPSLSAQTEVLDNKKASINTENKSLQTEMQFEEFLLNWAPPNNMLAEETEYDKQVWLFETKLPRNDRTEKSIASSDIPRSGNLVRYPCARYLPHADIYAMPFTMLF